MSIYPYLLYRSMSFLAFPCLQLISSFVSFVFTRACISRVIHFTYDIVFSVMLYIVISPLLEELYLFKYVSPLFALFVDSSD